MKKDIKKERSAGTERSLRAYQIFNYHHYNTVGMGGKGHGKP